MTYDEFVKQVENKFMHETIYKDSEGRPILVIQLLDAYYMMSALSKREWVGLTDKEIIKIANMYHANKLGTVGSAFRAVEAKLKEKNT